MNEQKTVAIGYPHQRHSQIRVEFPGGQVDVRTGLRNNAGQRVVLIAVSADHYAGETPWEVVLPDIVEPDKHFYAVRLVEHVEARYCPRCGSAWAAHNDDGSCVEAV